MVVVYEGCVPFLAVQSGCAVGGPLDKGGWVWGVGGGGGGDEREKVAYLRDA